MSGMGKSRERRDSDGRGAGEIAGKAAHVRGKARFCAIIRCQRRPGSEE